MRLCAFCSEVRSWQVVFYKHWESGMCCTSRSYLWNCNRSACSRHEAAGKDFSKIGCGCLWSLSTVTFTYGNVLTELRAGKNNGWALFFNLCIMLLNLWERPAGKGNRLTLLQLGGSKAFSLASHFMVTSFILLYFRTRCTYWSHQSAVHGLWFQRTWYLWLSAVVVKWECTQQHWTCRICLIVAFWRMTSFLFSKLCSYDIDDFLPVEANILYCRP